MSDYRPDQTVDEYHGIGGSYVVNPETGKREPAPPADEPQPEEPAHDE